MFSQHTMISRTLSLSGMILSGLLLGFYWQRMADSGELLIPKIMVTCALSAGSYLAAFLVVETLKMRREGTSWIISCLIGSILSAFNIKVVLFLIANQQDPFSPSF